MAKKEKEKGMFFINKLAREVTIVLIFVFIVCSALSIKVQAAESLTQDTAIFCEQLPEKEEEHYYETKKEIKDRIIIETELMGLGELNELEKIALGRKRIVATSKTTAYCPCKKCCGKEDGITYYEVEAQQYRTVAADKRYPNGTIVHIPSLASWPNKGWFVVEDRGGAIKNNKLDIFFDSHKAANKYGIEYHEVEFYLP